DLARWRDVRVSYDIGARYVVAAEDGVEQGHQRVDLRVGEFAVTERVSGVVEFDAHAGRVNVLVSTPVAGAGVPGALVLFHQPNDFAVFGNEIMRTDFCGRVGQALQRRS